MAAYAALVSLMNIMDQIQNHPRFSTCFNKNHMESLGDTAGFLLDFIESYNFGGGSQGIEDVEGDIATAAHAAEDVIETHIVDLILAESNNKNLEGEIASEFQTERQFVVGSTKKKGGLLQKMMRHIRKKPMKKGVICDLQRVMEDLDSIKEDIRKVEKQGRVKHQSPDALSRPISAGKTTMVGFDDCLIHLMDRLTGQQPHQQVLPIVGMGDVGKTTLARNAFDNLLIKQHFDVRAWATISQNYSTREILLEILSSQMDSKYLVDLNEQELGEKLHKCLFNRRYLITLDDMWSIEVWDDIKFFFPDNSNGSRVVVTTRLVNVAVELNSSYFPVNLLDEDKSWNLFCQEIFGKEGCPVELEEVGKKICKNCRGLPLSIVVTGGFLQKSSKSREYWEDVARDTYSILNSEGDNQCMNILSLSYKHLPAHLKPCFLYMGTFAEDEVVLVSQLVKLWVAEGFLKPRDAQSLEEVAVGYLKDLVGRNLILVNRWGSNGKIRACNIHDLIRELCLNVAEKEKFLCVIKLVGAPPAINRERRIVIHESLFKSEVFHDLSSVSLVRSLVCKGNTRLVDSKLLRVLRAVNDVQRSRFLEANLSHVNLRCLDYQRIEVGYYGQSLLYFPKKISLLWNLQTLRINVSHRHIIAPSELWEMVQLRHVQVRNLYVPDPPRNDRGNLVLPYLQTLCNAMNFRLSEEVCKRIPNVKKLNLEYGELPQGCGAGSYYCPQNLGRFHKLESLTLEFGDLNWPRMVLNMKFPSSLKKLSLYCSSLHWEDLEMIGSLPNLEVLKLMTFSMTGSEWNVVEGQFCRLKFLQIHFCQDLTKWNADSFHFPVLEKLVLGHLLSLDEIPSGIGEIPTLKSIRLFQCSVSSAFSAVKILEEQESYGHEDLQVEVGFHISNVMDAERFREMMEEDGFTSNNLHVHRASSFT